MIKSILLLVLLFFMAGSFLFAYILLYNERKRKHTSEKKEMQRLFDEQLLQSQFEVQEHTYSALSRELHDNIGQLLNSTKLLIGVAQREIENPPALLDTANEILGNAIGEIRSLSKSLDKEWLQQFRLLENISLEIKRINTSGTISASLETDIEKVDLISDKQLILFRIIQEALQNAIKHSQANTVVIKISEKDQSLHISISDNGIGYYPQQTALLGMGILHMRNRCEILGGNMRMTSDDFDAGLTVHISIPLFSEHA